MDYYFDVLRKYVVFRGRSGRAEFWYFVLISAIISIILDIIQQGDSTFLSDLYSMAVFLPSLGVAIRRMHDINKSGWFIIIPIYNIVLWARKSTEGPNRFDQ